MKNLKTKIQNIVLIITILLPSSSLLAQSSDHFVQGKITSISESRKVIVIDQVSYKYDGDTNLYYEGGKDQKKVKFEYLEPGFIVEYEAIRTEEGLLLINIGWVTG